jgi:hypothetical protein
MLERVAATPGSEVFARPPGLDLDPEMAVLLLGLQGSGARNALPVLIRLHARCPGPETGPSADRRLIWRVIQSIDPAAASRLPAAGALDESEDWP